MKGRKTGGRVKGTPNKLTTAFKTAVLTVYQGIGGDDAFTAWAQENQTEFYKIAARLIPTEVSGPDGDAIPLKTVVEHHYS